ncbi:uncharacterized protein EI97DRAFT_43305 [Westerdykella ornata]|uniref:Cation-transporting P-type ATPase N-terminal domain-containing protein n=1 Tax=Westerdykella ornata TaxID=318751 RepID=A0A6A6JLK7_WESOR|nr:uncharacterized protein EI97DRAFT_43305 [Westerdykella ornata]KAF2276536.1 hypothetical protein EI97DRAFT_43305 [Westerdykella ornata]
MGEENSLPTVEESTEPPLCALRSGIHHHHGPETTARHSTPQPHDERPPKSLSIAHTLTAAQVAKELGVDIQNGLSATEAESRLRLYGPNKVKGAEGLSLWEILLRQVSNSLTIVSTFLPGRGCFISTGGVRLPAGTFGRGFRRWTLGIPWI